MSLLSIWSLAAIIFLAIVYIALSALGAWRAMEIPRRSLKASPRSAGLPYEDVAFRSRVDRVPLKGWFLPGKNRIVIIIIHGGFENRIDENCDTLGISRDLVGKGYNVLLFDLRGRGESGGKGRCLSHIDNDLGGAVDFLLDCSYKPEDIYILGFCSGAASACIFAEKNSVGGVILDGCFIDVPAMATREAGTRHIPRWLTWLFIPGMIIMARIMYGYRKINPIDVISKVACPVFFIHEENDSFTTWEETCRLYQASGNPYDQIWQVSQALHSQSYRTKPREYIEKIDSFLNKTLHLHRDSHTRHAG